MKCESLNRRDGKKQTVDTRIYFVIRIATKARSYIYIVEALTKSIASGNQISSVNTITAILIPLSTKELAHKEWGGGSPYPRTKLSTPLHIKSEGC